MDQTRTPPPQQLPGYDLVECLGAGAYGEVWKATAPGGLAKAIKYVFGQLNGERATAELKAMERVKQVRHPYLLSLERIEVLDGRLVIVSEMADGCLRDRFRECLGEGKPGIPRDELLGCLTEVAEALDFLAREHQLLHLDVKPENILLLAGHTKVADFGLVKSINDQAQSIVGGMTPIYAAPEVFKGSPDLRSDQYSLAVMYQELLTGKTPFNGTNAAELTMQHLQDTPDLSSLDDRDRFAVSQALAKSPNNRFESCAQFIEALRQASLSDAKSTAPRPTQPNKPSSTKSTGGVATEVFSIDGDSEQPKPSTTLELPPIPSPAIHTPVAPDCPEREFVPTPAVFIGLGGFGGQTLGRLAQKITQRLGGDAPPPTMPLLYIDTDPTAIQQACRVDASQAGLTPEQTLLLALRRPQEYREKAASMLSWISRRWLYNIPRSLRTEGIRPLGRLALLDHARRAMQRVRTTLTSATTPESREAARSAGHHFREQGLRVYLVSSINGGAGSAMTADTAFAVRAILDRLGIEDASITGLMINGLHSGAHRSELPRVNAYAWLTEFEHYQQPGNAYPGDAGAGLPPQPADTPMFDNAYLLDLGAGMDANQFAAGIDNAAEYLIQDALTPAQHGIEACRKASDAPRGSLRAFCLSRTESAPPAERDAAATRLLNSLADSWCGEQATSPPKKSTRDTNHLVRNAATLVGRLQLDSAGLVANCRTAVERASSLADPPPAQPAGFAQIADALSTGLFDEIKSDLYRRLLDDTERIDGALRAADWYGNYFGSTRTKLEALMETARAESQRASQADRQTQVNLASLQVALLVNDRLSSLLSTAQEGLASMTIAFRGLANTPSPTPSPADDRWQRLAEQRMPEMLNESNTLLTAELSESTTDFLSTCSQTDASAFADLLKTVATSVIDRCLIGVTAPAGFVSLADGEEVSGGEEASDEQVPNASEGDGPIMPTIAQWGATLRQVVAASPEAEDEAGPFLHSQSAVRIPTEDGSCCLITECDSLSLPHIAGHLVSGRRDYAELAARVLTRRDIDWSPLIKPKDETPPIPLPPSPSSEATIEPTCVISS